MERTCRQCQAPFIFSDAEREFLQRMQFTFGKTKVDLPEPIHCPACRLQRKTCHRNERYLYKGKSSLSGKDMVALYDEGAPWGEAYTVYSQDEWHSDTWDAMTYAKDLDLERSIFAQLAELTKAVPHMGLITIGNENSDFTTGTGYCKNCYLINSSENCEDCYYGKLFQDCKSCVDCSYMYDCELCYDCFSLHHCYGCQGVSFSNNCTDCLFSSVLRNCKNCCLCTNLNNKEYHFMNQPLDKAEYEKRVAEFRGSHALTEKVKLVYLDIIKKMMRKYGNIGNSENCTGDYIDGSKNCLDCYDMNDSQDCRYVQVGVKVNDNYDCSNFYLKPQLCYDFLGAIETYNSAYSLFIFYGKNMLYSEYCFNCSDCFACNGLTRKQYCILNKQYTKEDYEALVPKIIDHMKKMGEWGLFFPPSMAPFAYNESLAQEYFLLTKEEAKKRGFSWREKDIRDFKPATAAAKDHIKDVPDTITKEMLAC